MSTSIAIFESLYMHPIDIDMKYMYVYVYVSFLRRINTYLTALQVSKSLSESGMKK